MIKIFKISTIIFVLFVIGAPSCEDEQEIAKREEAILIDTKKSIRTEFETDYLDETSLFAYETTAKQKLSDLSDYIQILTDTSLNMSFRIKAGEMINNTFKSESVIVQLFEYDNKSAKGLAVNLLVSMGLGNEFPIFPFSIDSISIYKPLQRIDNSTYFGVLLFSQNFTDGSNSDQFNKPIKRFTDFYVVKESKIFGTDSIYVWNVSLGEIR